MTTSEAQKRACKKWIAGHREKWNEISKLNQRKYDCWKRITKIYRNILLENPGDAKNDDDAELGVKDNFLF